MPNMNTIHRQQRATSAYQEARSEIDALTAELDAIEKKAEGRALTKREEERVKTLHDKVRRAARNRDDALAAGAFDPRGAGGVPALNWDEFGAYDQPNRLGPEQRMIDHVRQSGGGNLSTGLMDVLADPGSGAVGKLVRGMVTGRWPDADDELRALSIGVDAAGGYLVPDILAARVIDRLRAAARVMQAGAVTVPLPPAQEYAIARLTGGATPSWKLENQPIADSDLTFDRVVFKPKTLPVLIKLSMELFEDLSPDANQAIETEIAKSLGLALDAAALRGSGVDPEPEGILHQSGVTIQTLGTGNGASLTGYGWAVDALSAIRNANGDCTGAIFAPRTQQSLDKMLDSLGQPLRAPASVEAVPFYTSNQVPTNLHVGTSTDCSEAYFAHWASCLVGIRTDMRFQMRVLEERFIDTGTYGLLAYLRADVQLEHPELFTVVQGIRP